MHEFKDDANEYFFGRLKCKTTRCRIFAKTRRPKMYKKKKYQKCKTKLILYFCTYDNQTKRIAVISTVL